MAEGLGKVAAEGLGKVVERLGKVALARGWVRWRLRCVLAERLGKVAVAKRSCLHLL